MKAYVDKNTCIGCGLCVGTCPEVFSMGTEGKSVAITADIPSSQIDKATEAKDNCPVSAITVE